MCRFAGRGIYCEGSEPGGAVGRQIYCVSTLFPGITIQKNSFSRTFRKKTRVRCKNASWQLPCCFLYLPSSCVCDLFTSVLYLGGAMGEGFKTVALLGVTRNAGGTGEAFTSKMAAVRWILSFRVETCEWHRYISTIVWRAAVTSHAWPTSVLLEQLVAAT